MAGGPAAKMLEADSPELCSSECVWP